MWSLNAYRKGGAGLVGERVRKGFMEIVIVHNFAFFIHNMQSVLGIKENR